VRVEVADRGYQLELRLAGEHPEQPLAHEQAVLTERDADRHQADPNRPR
jgi:hypothetical protein